jgi:hypothetical protein
MVLLFPGLGNRGTEVCVEESVTSSSMEDLGVVFVFLLGQALQCPHPSSGPGNRTAMVKRRLSNSHAHFFVYALFWLDFAIRN